jgi:hypothetical protein
MELYYGSQVLIFYLERKSSRLDFSRKGVDNKITKYRRDSEWLASSLVKCPPATQTAGI